MFSSNDFKYVPRCQDCKHADLYIPDWSYPFTAPKCLIHRRSIVPGDVGCKDFELLGRLSR